MPSNPPDSVQHFEPIGRDQNSDRIIVIGSGPVGVRFVDHLLKSNPLANVRLFGNEPFQPYNRVQLTALLAGDIKRDDIDLPLPSKETHPGFQFTICRINKIEINELEKYVEDANSDRYQFDTLVFATGARAHIPNIDGVNQKGVYTFRNLKDTEHLYARIASTRHVVVVGGGLLGLEAAKGMRKANTKVTLVQQGSHLMNRQLDKSAAAILQRQVEEIGIEVITNSGVREIIGEGTLTGVKTNSGETIECDTLLLCAGIRPNVELARSAGISVKNGIIVNDQLQTSEANIYAIGECCEHQDITYGVVNPGFEQAAIAAEVIASGSEQVAYRGSLFVSSLKVVGESVTSMGEVNELTNRPFLSELSYSDNIENKSNGRESENTLDSSSLYRKVVFHRGRIIGAAAIGDWPERLRIQEAYQQGRYFWLWQRLWFKQTGRLWFSNQSEDVSDWPENAIVCQCNNISVGQLVAEIDAGANTSLALQQTTKAGTVCGSCKPLLNQLIGAGAVIEKETGWIPLIAGSLVALFLAASMFLVPESQVSESFQTRSWFEHIWNDKYWKQVTGFSLLGLSAVGLLLSLRKRLGFDWMGKVAYWRIAHSILGVCCAVVLLFHTGFHLGDNLNRLLLIDFLGVLILGAGAGAIIGLSHHLRPVSARSTRKFWSWVHILFTWPLPALLAVHILTVYYF